MTNAKIKDVIEMEGLNLLEYIRKVYQELSKTPLSEVEAIYRGIYGDAKWISDPDCHFVMTLCWIARIEEVQWALWDKVRPIFQSKYGGDIRNIEAKEDCKTIGYPKRLVPYDWLPNLSRHLRSQNKSFGDFLEERKDNTGIEIRDELKSILGIRGEAKRISVFIRDFLKKDVFPIDINVRYVLRSLGLPEHEEMMVHLCRNAGADPKVFERLLYRHGQEICGKGEECPLAKLCLSSVFGLNRCRKLGSRASV